MFDADTQSMGRCWSRQKHERNITQGGTMRVTEDEIKAKSCRRGYSSATCHAPRP